MKSILQEAASIERAIDKAWNEAGKPKEFTIKILDYGERNFFGLMRRPAIVSILYKPEKVTQQPVPSRRHNNDDRNDRRARGRDNVARRQDDQRESRQSDRRDMRVRGDYDRSSNQASVNDASEWRTEWKDFVVQQLNQLLKLLNRRIPFTAQTDKDKVLSLTFKSSFAIGSEDDQRSFFASLSYLLIQFLKREYKNRFTGFRIVVTGPLAKHEPAGNSGKNEGAKAPSEKQHARSRDSRNNDRRQQQGSRRSGNEQRSTRFVPQSEEHISEQLRFAKQQLDHDNEVVDALNQAVQSVDAIDKASVVTSAPQEVVTSEPVKKEPVSVSQDEKVTAPQEAVSRSPKPLKEGVKYQPFFVMPDKDDSDKK